MDWIDVNDELPEIGEEVNVFTVKGIVTSLCRYIRHEGSLNFYWDNRYGGGCVHVQNSITHWMPLPEPPKTTQP